ncbi:MAG TPA: hypothetical protein VFE38_15485 [Edaphobacter sp.]|nr:hypothetical protein [Edaphobacter sp.]
MAILKTLLKISARALLVVLILWLGFAFWWIIASDYGDEVIAGTYHLDQDGEKSTLLLRSDHTFQQELKSSSAVEHAEGSWRRSGEGGISFSKEFLMLSGQEREPDRTGFGEIHKLFGFWLSIKLRQYHVLWYCKPDHSASSSLPGTYTGNEPGVMTSLTLNPDHTFNQTVSYLNTTKHSEGSWNVRKSGDVNFSKEFLKTSGEALTPNEMASAMDPRDSHCLQIEVAKTSKSGEPTYHKRQLFW